MKWNELKRNEMKQTHGLNEMNGLNKWNEMKWNEMKWSKHMDWHERNELLNEWMDEGMDEWMNELTKSGCI